MKRSTRLALLGAAALTVALSGFGMLSTSTSRGPCRCPQVYAPVECDNGKVYPNQCVADCRRAKNCTPVGAL